MHISTTIHLKPVNVFLIRHTKHKSPGGKDNNLLFQLVETA